MTYEQIFLGKILLAKAIRHIRNRALTLTEFPASEIIVIDGRLLWAHKDESDALSLLESCYWQLEREFQHKRSKKTKVSA